MASTRPLASCRPWQPAPLSCPHPTPRRPLCPQVLALIKNPHYLYRMTVLVAISMLATIVSVDVVCNLMLPVIVSAAKDKVRQRPRAGQGGGAG